VQLELELDPFQPELFVFVGKKKDRIRLLYWDGTGFAMWAKQLEKGKYAWPKSFQACVYSMSYRDLQMLLDGYDIWRMKPHQQLQFSQVV
jgi:transposase